MMVCLCTPIAANSESSARVIKAKWLDNPPIIDGVLSESIWDQAEIATNFFLAGQAGGIPAKLNTKAMVLYDADMLYIGVRCEEPNMNNLRMTQTRRDTALWRDDTVQVMLDTYDDQRGCYVLAVNALGTQMDRKISIQNNFDLGWDAKWEAKVQRHDDHWTAEIAIPFRELRLDPQVTSWGINFARPHPMDGAQYSWSDTGSNYSRASEFGKLTNLDFNKVDIDRKIGVLPYATHRYGEDQQDGGNTGLDLVIPMSTNITTNLTFNPDFSQLESDSTQINISSNQELYLPERRPFFSEGSELFELPLDLFYTRRVKEIDYGVKSTGRAGDYNFALIDAYGKIVDRYDDDQMKQANLFAARVNRNIGKRTTIGAMGIQKHQDDRDVTLLSLDSQLALHRDWIAQAQYAADFLDGEMHGAYHASMNWRNRSGWSGSVRLEEIQDGFRPNETGLEDEAYRKVRSRLRYSHQFSEGSLITRARVGGFHVHQTDAQNRLSARRIGWSANVDIGRFDFDLFGGFGVQREDGGLFDRKYIAPQIGYHSKWGRLKLSNQFGTRQEQFNRYTRFSADVNLFSKLTVDLKMSNFFWREHQNTLVFRIRSNYQFTRKLGWGFSVERVDERLTHETKHNFSSILNYQFTPESNFFLVFADNTDGERVVMSKMSYLFESDFPF
jgi:hypothetical protein